MIVGIGTDIVEVDRIRDVRLDRTRPSGYSCAAAIGGPPSKKPVGDTCSANADCGSNVCTNNKCANAAAGKPGDIRSVSTGLYTTEPSGCFTGCYNDIGYHCARFNTATCSSNCGVDVSDDDFIYCRGYCPAPPAPPPVAMLAWPIAVPSTPARGHNVLLPSEELHDIVSDRAELPFSHASEQLQLSKLLMPESPGTRSGAARVHKCVSRTEIAPRRE